MNVTDVLPIVCIGTSYACCGKEMRACYVWYSLGHFTSGGYAKMPRSLHMSLKVVCCVHINFMGVLCIRNVYL